MRLPTLKAVGAGGVPLNVSLETTMSTPVEIGLPPRETVPVIVPRAPVIVKVVEKTVSPTATTTVLVGGTEVSMESRAGVIV